MRRTPKGFDFKECEITFSIKDWLHLLDLESNILFSEGTMLSTATKKMMHLVERDPGSTSTLCLYVARADIEKLREGDDVVFNLELEGVNRKVSLSVDFRDLGLDRTTEDLGEIVMESPMLIGLIHNAGLALLRKWNRALPVPTYDFDPIYTNHLLHSVGLVEQDGYGLTDKGRKLCMEMFGIRSFLRKD